WWSTSGASQIGTLNPFIQIEAQTICWESGVETEVCSEGGMDVSNIENGDYIKVKGVDFGSGATSFDARVASANSGGNIEIRLDSPTGKVVGTCAVSGTGGWQNWVTKSCAVSGATGIHDLYFKFTGGSGFLFNVNWWKFTQGISSPTLTATSKPTPTPSSGNILDINHDGAINMADVILLARVFNTVKGNAGFVDAYDLNRDGIINMSDLVMIAAKFNTVV
ncbi:MAG: carbohydrate-binding protein, partial [Bacillota bacterium]|nr:carbohydrate-binding protein [Bacillota bacterium]